MDVVIIGAGYTGLAAAYRLSQRKFNVALLEASQRCGGRAMESIVSENFRLELGAQYISDDQKLMTKLASELGLELFPAWSAGDNFFAANGEIKRFQTSPAACLTEMFGYPKEVEEEIEALLRQLSELSSGISTAEPWQAKMAQEWDSITFHSWLERYLKSAVAKQFFRAMTNQGFSTEPEQISLLQMLWFLKSSHGIPKWTIGGSQPRRIVGGTQQVAERLASRLSGKISLYERVVKIQQAKDKVFVHTDRDTFFARFAIVCVPPQLIHAIQYLPPLPPDLFRAFGAMQSGNAMKVQAIYKRPFWRPHGWSGNGIDFDAPQSFTYDNSSKEGSPGVLLGFLTARHATEWNQRSKEERRLAVLQSWAKIFGREALEPLEYEEMDWMSDPFIRGGHGTHFPPGFWCELGPALGGTQMPHYKRLFWAASDLAKDWSGYLEGALLAGEQVAYEVEKALAMDS